MKSRDERRAGCSYNSSFLRFPLIYRLNLRPKDVFDPRGTHITLCFSIPMDRWRETSGIDMLKEKVCLKPFHFTGNDAPVIALSVWPGVIFVCQDPGRVNPTKIHQLILHPKIKRKSKNILPLYSIL